jgi:hypothetical protein
MATSEHDTPPVHRSVAVVESVLLAVVALLAGWSGYAAARWSTESRLALAEAAAARTEASQANLDALEQRNLDATMFNTWFTAWTAGNEQTEALALRRFRPEFRRAFDAWLATDPATNPAAPAGPLFMAEYDQPDLIRAAELNRTADQRFVTGSDDAARADHYVQVTVLLAAILFIVGIGTHIGYRGARLALVGIAGATAVYAAVLIATAPRPPG